MSQRLDYFREQLAGGKIQITESAYVDDTTIGTVAEFVAWATGAVPIQFCASARLKWTLNEDCRDAIVGLTYERPETDAEYETRMTRCRREIARIEANERADLATLRAKYGDGGGK